jgi:hypothetical protein
VAVTVGTPTVNAESSSGATIEHDNDGDGPLVARIGIFAGADGLDTAATYNGVAGTLEGAVRGTNSVVLIFSWAAPATGPNDLVVDGSAWSTTRRHRVVINSTFGCDGVEGFVSDSNTDSVTASTLDVTSAADDLVLDTVAVDSTGGGQAFTPGAGQTEDDEGPLQGTGNVGRGASSQETGAGTVTMSWTWDVAARVAHCAVNLTAAAAGGVTLTVADLAVAASIDSPALTQANVLAVDGLSVAATLDSPALSSGIELVAAGLDVASAIDSPALTQANVLVVDALTVASAVDAPALTQANVLVPDDLSVGVALDSPALTQAHVLAVQALAVAGAIDSPTLSLSTLLTVADALVAVSLDSPALTQAHILAVAELVVATSIDAPALTQAHTLSVAELLVSVLLDGVTLPGAEIDLRPPFTAAWIDPARVAAWVDPARTAHWE